MSEETPKKRRVVQCAVCGATTEGIVHCSPSMFIAEQDFCSRECADEAEKARRDFGKKGPVS